MKYEAIDTWNSPSLEHYGVKGMKWGVRKVVQRVGTGVRRLGGASVRVAKATAKGLYGAGSAIRRYKNRRAIKSADPNRILKRVNKMSNQELNDALTRVELAGKIRGNVSGDGSLRDAIKTSITKEVGKISAETLRTSVESIAAKERPSKGINRDARLSISKKEQKIAENRLKAKKDRVSLKDIGKTPVKTIKKHNKKAGRADYYVNLSSGKTAVNKLLLKKRKRRLNDNPADGTGRYKYLYQTDIKMGEDFLVHYGVKGMKWGVIHGYQRKLNGIEKKYSNNVEKKLKYIRKANTRMDKLLAKGISEKRLSKDRVVRKNIKKAMAYDNNAKAAEQEVWKTLGEISKAGGSVKVTEMYKAAPGAQKALLGSKLLFSGYNPVESHYLKKGAYASSTMNQNGDTPYLMKRNRYYVYNNIMGQKVSFITDPKNQMLYGYTSSMQKYFPDRLKKRSVDTI